MEIPNLSLAFPTSPESEKFSITREKRIDKKNSNGSHRE